MIFDEYVDVINQIENINKRVNQENRLISNDEAKKEIKLLIHLLELKNAQVDITKINREAVIDSELRSFNHAQFYEAITKNNEYECAITDDFPSSFSIISIDGINNDHTDAAIITPDANPNKIFSTFLFISFFIKNTIAAPSVVPINGITKPKNICIILSLF